MNMDFKRKLPIPKELKEQFPLDKELAAIKEKNDEEIKKILEEGSELFDENMNIVLDILGGTDE